MTEQILSFSLSNLNLSSYCNFHLDVKSLIEAATPAALHIEVQAPTYFKLVNDVQSIVRRIAAYQSTEGLKEKDKTRDAVVGVIMSVVQAHCFNPAERRSKAAKALRVQLSAYKGLAAHNYSAATAETNGLLSVLLSEKNLPHVTALNLESEVEMLESANAAMAAMIKEKKDEIGTKTPQTDIETDQLRKELDEVYYEMVLMANAFAIAQPSEVLSQFVFDMNNNIKYYRDVANNQGKGGQEETEETEGSDDPTDGDTPASDTVL